MTARRPLRLLPVLAMAAAACDDGEAPRPRPPLVSSTLALSPDEATLWVANADADSVSVIDVGARRLLGEVALGPTPPAVDPVSRRYDPRLRPRALALSPDGRTLYVAAQSANRVVIVDTAARRVTGEVEVAAEPTAVVVAPDGSALFVVSHQAAQVSRIEISPTPRLTATVEVGEHPFGAALSGDGSTLYVSHLLRAAGVSVIAAADLTLRAHLLLTDEARRVDDKRVPSGVPRGAYAVVPRPGAEEDLWVPHVLLAVATPQPALDFESTVFPTFSRLEAPPGGTVRERSGGRLLLRPSTVPDAQGAFDDVVSGPRALAFTPDGALALALSSGSEDLLVLDGATGRERSLVRPLPSTFPEGVLVDRAGRRAFVEGRASHDVTVLSIDPADPIAPVRVDGPPIERLSHDPMPETLRLGQRLFYTANSAAFPVTRNFWVSCATCHIEGGTDGVTWLFAQGPRDTPSNAGGPVNTGFQLRQGLRTRVEEYDLTIVAEQGGRFDRDDPAQAPLLSALADFVNYAIPLPHNPYRAPGAPLTEAQRRGEAVFQVACASCHAGPFYTDSGAGNPGLDRGATVLLHDIGTCVEDGPWPDRPLADEVTGRPRTACDFDTPTLRGIFATPPYLHDGSAATLRDVVDRLRESATLPEGDKAALVEYMKTL